MTVLLGRDFHAFLPTTIVSSNGSPWVGRGQFS
jgi:hypothetical protein